MQLFSNNASTTISSIMAIGATFFDAASTSMFSSPSGGNYELLTLTDGLGNYEIVKMTTNGGTYCTVTRAQEGTTEREWPIGTQVFGGITKETLASFLTSLAATTTALGSNAVNVQKARSTAAEVASGADAIAVGTNSKASAANATAAGKSAYATGSSSVAVGTSAAASGTNGVAVGNLSSATTGVAVGASASSSATDAVAVGKLSSAAATNAIAIGTSAAADGGFGPDAIAIGSSSNADGDSSVAVGKTASATGLGAVAIGLATSVTQNNAVALGNGASVDTYGTHVCAAVPIIPRPAAASEARLRVGSRATFITDELNLLAAGNTQFNLPTGVVMYVDSCEAIVTDVTGVLATQPTISFGSASFGGLFVGATAATDLDTVGARQVFASTDQKTPVTSLRADVNAPGSADTYKARFLFTGLVIKALP